MVNNLSETVDDEIRAILEGVVDPEIPVLNILELGIVRSAVTDGSSVTVRITPTYSGCPAMNAITREVESRLTSAGYSSVNVEVVYEEAWTTDWMLPVAREKLREFGIAPPARHADQAAGEPVACVNCGSVNTRIKSWFGSTACKALYVCSDCGEPFEAFKCI